MIVAGPYPGTNLIGHVFPLGPNREARLLLPTDLTLREVRRMTAMIKTLVSEAVLTEETR